MRNYEDVIGRCDQNPTYLDDAFLVFVVFQRHTGCSGVMLSSLCLPLQL